MLQYVLSKDCLPGIRRLVNGLRDRHQRDARHQAFLELEVVVGAYNCKFQAFLRGLLKNLRRLQIKGLGSRGPIEIEVLFYKSVRIIVHNA